MGEIMLWLVGRACPFPPPAVLSAPSFAYNHPEASLVRNKAAHAPIRGPRGPFWSCPLLISMQINKRTAIYSQIPFKKEPHARAFLKRVSPNICLLFEWAL